jgi:GT2 family glycosyltransferase/glycosyltransferase involved in cell wall biosynthesis
LGIAPRFTTVTATAPITVLVPVYKGVQEVRECLSSVVRHGATEPFELVVIDDATPDAEVRGLLAGFVVDDPAIDLTVLHNERNLGFPATVNRGLVHSAGDVVILNADTVVTAGWLDRLRQAAADEADIATVTPLTNFGSICTVPPAVAEAFDLDGTHPRVDDAAAFVARHGLGRHPEVISGVGFCMYVTREAIDACGLFDAETFGAGYGEEVDFCIRATRLGFRHVVEDRTFVFHHGGVSFGEERDEGLERGSALIRHRYPFFRPSNRRERAADPLAPTFASFELGLRERDPRRPHVLHILHSAPDALGGTEKHLGALLSAMLPDCDFSILHPVTSGFVLRTLWLGADGDLIEHEFLLPSAPRWVARVEDANAGAALQIALDMFEFDAVHVQNLINHSLAPLEVLGGFGGRVVCSVRDLYLACPNHWLLYHGHACGVPADLSYCATCLPETRDLPLEYLEQFRATVAEHIDTVQTWVFATQSAADYLLRVYDISADRIEIIEHGALIELSRRRTEVDDALIFDEPLRVAFVGLGRAKKGLDTVGWLADMLCDTDIEIHHFGELGELTSGHVQLHGAYDNNVLPELLDTAGIQVVLLPGAYAETFGHVMTEALVAGKPVIGASYGALGERIRATGAGWTIDPAQPQQVLALLKALDECREELHRGTQAAIDAPIRSIAGTAPRYLELYQPGGSR